MIVMYNTSHYGGLEYLAQNAKNYASPQHTFYSIAAQPYNEGMFILPRDSAFNYSPSENAAASYSLNPDNYLLFTPTPEYHFIPDNFLQPGKEGIFVGKAEEVREFVEETFGKIFQQPFPNNIKMSILNHEEFRKIAPSPNTIGLSINRSQQGLLSEIFILNDFLGRVMLTIGHELGHVLTKTLSNPHDEEAKAYAFSLAWMKVMKEHNIADLGEAIIVEHPAENGLHNVAFTFVHDLLLQGKETEEIYEQIITEKVSFTSLTFVPN